MPLPNGFEQSNQRESRWRRSGQVEQKGKGLQEDAAKCCKIMDMFRASSAGQFDL